MNVHQYLCVCTFGLLFSSLAVLLSSLSLCEADLYVFLYLLYASFLDISFHMSTVTACLDTPLHLAFFIERRSKSLTCQTDLHQLLYETNVTHFCIHAVACFSLSAIFFLSDLKRHCVFLEKKSNSEL